MTDLTALIERLEKAEGPSNALDDLIYEIVVLGNNLKDQTYRPFTSSIDAALTLVPEGVSTHIHILPGSSAAVVGHQKEESISLFHPAISLCIAALKARGSE